MKRVITLACVTLGLTIAYFSVNTFFHDPTEAQLVQEISESLHVQLTKADEEASKLISAKPTSEIWSKVSFSFFDVHHDSIVAWSNNEFVPDLGSLKDEFNVRYFHYPKGNFILRKWLKSPHGYLLLVLPLEFNFGITNDYLLPFHNNTILPSTVTVERKLGVGACINYSDNDCLFKVSFSDKSAKYGVKGKLLLVMLILIVLCFIITMHYWVMLKNKNRFTEWSFLSLIVLLFSTRIIMVRENFPGSFVSLQLFDPSHYASSSFNASIGDLFINSAVVLVLCLLLFFNYPKFHVVKWISEFRGWKALIAASVSIFICYLSFLYPYLFIETVYHNSSITYEITQSLSFDVFRIVAFFSLLFGCASAYLFITVFFRIALFVQKKAKQNFIFSFLVASLFFLIFFISDGKDYWVAFWVCLLLLPTLYFSKLAYQNPSITFKTYLYFLLMIIAFSIEFSVGVYKFNQERKIGDQFKFGNNYLIDQDILAEFLLQESSSDIARDKTIAQSFDSLQKTSVIQDKVKQLYFNSYFERYDVHVYSYNSNGTPHDKLTMLDFNNDLKKLSIPENKSPFEGIYFINDPSSDTLKRYISITPIKNNGEIIKGYVVLDLSLKKVIPETVFPELLVDNRFGQYFKNKDFSYALFSNKTIASSFGDFNYEKKFNQQWLGQSDLYRNGIIEDNYRHVAIEYQDNRIAVISSPVYSFEYIVINFSFFVALGLSTILIILLIIWLLSWTQERQLTYTSRIQLYVYLAFFVPLLLVSLVTLRLVIISAENQKQAEYLSKAKILVERISPILFQFHQQGPGYQRQLESKMLDMADVANLDASIYSNAGKLITSSEPLIFENQLLSSLISRVAWSQIITNRENYFVSSETIGKLRYHSVYLAIKSPVTGQAIGVLSIPFFESSYSLERTQINVVSAILGVFSIAFILFSLLSYFFINGLTAPLRFITQALRRISLTGINKPIHWKAKDEIGLMANEYNRMLLNLEESKTELQKSQKEIAWREIAQQVAHEIKNPLTPMKLTLQQLEQGFSAGHVSEQKTKKSIDVLLKQVDILNDIASSFSAFAKMPAPKIVKLDIRSVLQRTVDLFINEKGTKIMLHKFNSVNVLGDESILLRAFSNIVLNGIQATKENQLVEIDISFVIQNENCLVSIRDNGKGIDEGLRNKIFKPHFTTKSTGSGLGLAIVKQTIELCGGAIWFETETNEGTTFIVQLPLAINNN